MTKKYWLVAAILIIMAGSSSGQIPKGVTVTGGIGVPELMYAGVRYKAADRSRIGVTVGTVPLPDEFILSLGFNHYYYFGKRARRRGKFTWYCRQGISHIKNETSRAVESFTYVTLAAGRDIKLKIPIGIALDLGIGIKVQNEEKIKSASASSGWAPDLNVPVIPVGRIQFFYRIGDITISQ